MRETLTFDLVEGDKVTGTVSFLLESTPDLTRITLVDEALGSKIFEGDSFEALSKFRRHLEAFGLKPACLGASRYVYPSGMSRSMTAGRAAYLLESQRPATKDDIVDIFDPLPPNMPLSDLASVAEQEAFRMSLFTS